MSQIQPKSTHPDTLVPYSTLVRSSTGLIDLDNLLGGLHSSDLLILAARPAMGKTSLATNIAFDVATASIRDPGQPRQPVAFFSLEMSSEQLATRILAERTGDRKSTRLNSSH